MAGILFIVLIFAAILYVGMVVRHTIGWIKCGIDPIGKRNRLPELSIIVAARDEEKTIGSLLKSLVKQDYPISHYEVIIVNDHSDDATVAVITQFIERKNLENFHILENTSESGIGKKSAIEFGLKRAKGEIIITTDSDCTMGAQWLRSMVKYFPDNQCEMVIGPVDIESSGGVFTKLQALEFMSLTGSTAGSAAWGVPIMCNGANLAFRKVSWIYVQEKILGKKYASGDDVFLMQAFLKEFPGKVTFNKNQGALVTTAPSPDLVTFFNQRTRWASKAGGYDQPAVIITGAIVALFNVLLSVITLFAIILPLFPLKLLLIIWIVKFLVDFPLLFMVSRFIGKIKLLGYYLPLQCIYPFYVSIVLLRSLSGAYIWKGRKLQ